jgi:pilus assembly protein CpaE
VIARRILVASRNVGLQRDVQAAAGGGFMVYHHARAADVEEFVELKGPFDIMVAGPIFDSKAGLDRLRKLREDYPAMPVILAFPSPQHTPVPDLVRVGAVDLVEDTSDRRRLGSAIRRAVTTATSYVQAVTPVLSAEEAAKVGEVISVASPSGGCGKTFYSTNMGYFLAAQTGKRVCLVDLDLQFGEVTSALRLRPRYTIADLVGRMEAGEIDLDAGIEDFLLVTEAGFWVLPAPHHPAEADRVALSDINKIVAALQRRFDYVICDTSAQLSEITIAALEMSTALICMATVDLPSIRNMRVFLDTLDRLGISAEAVTVVLNKVEDDIGLKVEEVNEALHQKVVSVLPYAREVSRSINQGMPVLVSDPKAGISRRLAEGMNWRLRLGGAEATDGAPGGTANGAHLNGDAKKSLGAGLRRMLNRKETVK